MKIKQISPDKHIFLQRLECIALKPKMLYYYGKLPDSTSKPSPLLDRFARPRSVAIVGSRKMTPYGEKIAYKAAYDLAAQGLVVISGLATGIDSAAHRGALDAGGLTLGVLGTPIDRIYPRENTPLVREIIEKGGAVLSECPPFITKPDLIEPVDGSVPPDREEIALWSSRLNSRNGAKAAFLHRNRLISALADAVIVVEADERSGSLNTASHALEQGRILFAVPGDLNRQLSRGCNALFGKGALAFTSVDDVLDELFIPHQKKRLRKIAGSTPAENTILAALHAGLSDGDQIIVWSKSAVNLTKTPDPASTADSGSIPTASSASTADPNSAPPTSSAPDESRPAMIPLTPTDFSQSITLLELRGLVKRLLNNQWILR